MTGTQKWWLRSPTHPLLVPVLQRVVSPGADHLPPLGSAVGVTSGVVPSPQALDSLW